MSARHTLASLGLAAAVALTLTACPKRDGGGGAGTDAGAADAGADGGDAGVDAGDGKCHSDDHCLANEYCALATGQCLGAKPCASNNDCEYQATADDDYCAFGGCFCDPDRNGGTCRPRVKPCQACTRDLECGVDTLIYQDYAAKCIDYGGEKVCLPLKVPRCAPGYIQSTTGANCVPAGGSCDPADDQSCTKDDDCDPYSERPVCDKSRGLCVPTCIFDYQKGTSDCPPNRVCHVDPRLLTEDNPNFGGGKCGLPCEGEGAVACVANTACEPDGDPVLLANRPKRCRPPAPKCLRGADCPADLSQNSNGYCDVKTLECRIGCQRENPDCVGGFKCLQGQCVQKTCIENGGASGACERGAFCCGEANSVSPCATGVGAGQCYPAPKPPFCGACQGGAGEVVASPGGASRPLPSRCWTTQGQPLQWHSCTKGDRDGTTCPRGRACTPFLYFCLTNADCGAGGECQDFNYGDLGTFKGCGCGNGQDCPTASACNVKDQEGNNIACEAFFCKQDDCLPPP